MNATAITVHDAIGDGAIAMPAPDTLDTGSSAVTLPIALGGHGADRLMVEVANVAESGTLVVTGLAGDNLPLAHRDAAGPATLATLDPGAVAVLGPFEPERFSRLDGSMRLRFAPAAALGAEIRAIRLPRAIR